MSRPANPPLSADESTPAGARDCGVIAVTRALRLLESFAVGESQLSLAEFSRRCQLRKTTVPRLARTTPPSGTLVQRVCGDHQFLVVTVARPRSEHGLQS